MVGSLSEASHIQTVARLLSPRRRRFMRSHMFHKSSAPLFLGATPLPTWAPFISTAERHGIHGKLYLHAWYPTYSMFMAMSRLKRKGNGSSLRPTSADHGRDWAEDDKSVGKKVEPLDPADGIGEPVSNMQ
ncbi:predicted protein [Plenodomus lingam JN3]|uniref:Predicted protein n=1 Tax=Leptosphaeria maculans (strain JN3 / isolate v23.1.3 / race Av1-4-5-6-7-8) TaxID=985895 RepID=E4ZVH7_LEPMJ|nr:predicted protein [Plenodomus lingam JN3]CBX95603.1 predicted protein [Plenodomus lingam JN3]